VTEDVQRKITHAAAHLADLEAATDRGDIDRHFAALLPCLRTAQDLVAKALAPNGWNRIDAWVKTLSTEDQETWRAWRDLRNDDVHERAIKPVPVHKGGHFGPHFGSYFGRHFGGETVHKVKNEKTGAMHETIATSRRMLELVTQLATIYPTL
jgi:hypothetical protein